MVWKLLPTISAPMPLQMALDELLFESQKKDPQAPVLRFYISSEPWISVGCSFRGEADLSKSGLISKNPQVPVCRRVTGGGCVLHGVDLIFFLAARVQADPENLGAVRTSYARIHEGVKMGLQGCGLDLKFYSNQEKLPKGNDCFDFPVESDLAWKGKKIAGGAQKRSEGVLLHHESISIPPGVVREDLIRTIRRGLEHVFRMSLRNADLNPEIFFQAQKLQKTTMSRSGITDSRPQGIKQ